MRLHLGDCIDLLRSLESDSIDAIVTDPPYGLGKPPKIAALLRCWLAGDKHEAGGRGFMGAEWDAMVPGPDVWSECCRVLKPGGHLIAFAGQRTVDLMGVALRLGGFEIRDSGGWMTYQGFPKSLAIDKAIDRMNGDEREVLEIKRRADGTSRPHAGEWAAR
ncbi:MAG: site-specific DNA-methyltransferase, partial [bacterium]|nr:site-specific DNA-methyltransferase [bacterium]